MNVKKYHYQISIAKTAPARLDEYRSTNYQFLQNYHLTPEEVTELVRPTVEEIQEILQGMGKVVREITFDIHVGKRVKIIDGAFSGFEGPITEVNGDKVKVTVDMFGRETPVELDLQQIDEITY